MLSRLRHRWWETRIPGRENRMFKGQEMSKRWILQQKVQYNWNFNETREMTRPEAGGMSSGQVTRTL